MSRVIKMFIPKPKDASLPKTAALTKAQAEHKAWLKAHGIKAIGSASSDSPCRQPLREWIKFGGNSVVQLERLMRPSSSTARRRNGRPTATPPVVTVRHAPAGANGALRIKTPSSDKSVTCAAAGYANARRHRV